MTEAFVKSPKHILISTRISSDAKVVYLLLLNRLSLSEKNGWRDDAGRTYIIFPLSEIMNILGCSKSKASKVLSELDGLIEKKRRGLGKPDVIYVNKEYSFESAENNSAEIFDSNSKSETHDVIYDELLLSTDENFGGNTQETQEDLNSAPNYNKLNNNKINKNNFSYPSSINQYDWIEDRKKYIKIIKSNIQYDYLIANYSKPIIDDVVSVMTNVVCSHSEFIKINGNEVPGDVAKEKILALDCSHIEYVHDCVTNIKTRVKNMSAYLLTCLYNAHDVINIHYANMASADIGR